MTGLKQLEWQFKYITLRKHMNYTFQFIISMSEFSQIFFNDSSSLVFFEIQLLFIKFSLIVIAICLVVFIYIPITLVLKPPKKNKYLEKEKYEFIWTIYPFIVLLCLGIPSIKMLYFFEETKKPIWTIKAVGWQWYWQYEFSDSYHFSFTSYMLPDKRKNYSTRLLDTDNRLILPYATTLRIIVRSADVVHAWTVPSLGIKVDAVPGRMNQVLLFISRPGIFFGQCSEICGANHSFMPIALESINPESFIFWCRENVILFKEE